MKKSMIMGLGILTCLVAGAGTEGILFKGAAKESFNFTGDGQWESAGGMHSVRGGNESFAYVDSLSLRDFELEVDIRIDGEKGQAGIVFRAEPSGEKVPGYYVGLHAGVNHVMWGKMDQGWSDVSRKVSEVKAGEWYRLRLRVAGDSVTAYVNDFRLGAESAPTISGRDARFEKGAIALRKMGRGADFRNLVVRELRPTEPLLAYTNPVQAACADPVVLLHNGTYYAYCTYTPDFPDMVKGIRLYTSPDLVHWTDKGYVLKNEDSWGESRFWAPDIVEKEGTFYLYYAADERICVATARTPEGPFVQNVRQPMQPDTIRIDAHILQDDDGQNYIYYVHFNDGNEIWGGKLNDDMLTVDEDSLRLMVRPDQLWERHMGNVAEGPEVIKHKGIYYLTYSGSHFESPHYAVGYATSDSPLGPWKKYEHNPIMKSTEEAHGTAHHCLTTSPDGKEMFIVYHRHCSLTETEPRGMAIDRIRFVPQENGPDVLKADGPTTAQQSMPSGSVREPAGWNAVPEK
ncbi:family 43 glycosylhydrolase [Pontiellaceae bacterium B12227]|nr:family 43 glycosylhydrolase [Pontiellaceae bacterium B12227]